MTEAERFPGRLRELREQAGLTQQQLGDRAGVTWEAVSRWERGTREPSWSNVVALAKALGVECTTFLQEPAAAAPAGPGRPRKATTRSVDQQQPKRPRGRPRKVPETPGAAQKTSSDKETASSRVGKKRAAKGKGERT